MWLANLYNQDWIIYLWVQQGFPNMTMEKWSKMSKHMINTSKLSLLEKKLMVSHMGLGSFISKMMIIYKVLLWMEDVRDKAE